MSTTQSQGLVVDVERAVKLQTGEILHIDYRVPPSSSSSSTTSSIPIKPLKAVQWNIERGIKLDGIIDQLRQLDADIICLQEIDSGLSRSEYLETGIAIAHQLKLNYAFQSEFVELEGDIDKRYYLTQVADPLHKQDHAATIISKLTKKNQDTDGSAATSTPIIRDDPTYQPMYKKDPKQFSTPPKHSTKIQYHPTPIATSSTQQYGLQYTVRAEQPGVHGNAILTKFDISQTLAVPHHHHPYNWTRDGALLNEPRIGQRQTLCCVVEVPVSYVAQQVTNQHLKNTNQHLTTNLDTIYHAGHISSSTTTISLPVYTCHLELFCGTVDRLKTMGEIFQHFRDTFGDAQYKSPRHQTYGLLLGDYNTLAHSIARFSPNYCKDELRWGNLGYTEAEWWYRYVLDTTNYRHLLPTSSQYHCLDANFNHDAICLRGNDEGAGDIASSSSSSSSSSKPTPTTTPLQDLNLANLTKADCINLINPGFQEPFDPQIQTLTNYSGWFYGKLDWVLTMGLHTVSTDVFNIDYRNSDHRGLVIDFWLKSNDILDQEYQGDVVKLGEVFGDKRGSQQNATTTTTTHPLLPPKPYIPSHLQQLFVPRVFFAHPKSTTSMKAAALAPSTSSTPSSATTPSSLATTITLREVPANGVFSAQIYSSNDHYIIQPLSVDFSYGYYTLSDGFMGWVQRNSTFVQYFFSFVLPTMVALIYVLTQS